MIIAFTVHKIKIIKIFFSLFKKKAFSTFVYLSPRNIKFKLFVSILKIYSLLGLKTVEHIFITFDIKNNRQNL